MRSRTSTFPTLEPLKPLLIYPCTSVLTGRHCGSYPPDIQCPVRSHSARTGLVASRKPLRVKHQRCYNLACTETCTDTRQQHQSHKDVDIAVTKPSPTRPLPATAKDHSRHSSLRSEGLPSLHESLRLISIARPFKEMPGSARPKPATQTMLDHAIAPGYRFVGMRNGEPVTEKMPGPTEPSNP